MSAKHEDDFWNTSTSSGFNFDDDEDFSDTLKDFVFNSATEEASVFPIHAIISKNNLDLVLDDIKSTVDYVVPPVEETIKKMSNGQKYVLEVYRKLDEKILLLDSALETFDGNIIINVILFLKKTLRANIFHHQMSKRKLAVKHYANYLIINNQFQDLADMYMATGNTPSMKELFYLIGREVSNKNILHKRLEQFLLEHLQKSNSSDDKSEVNEYLQLLQWQIANKENCNSVIEQLAALCTSEWRKHKNSNEAVMEFKKKFKIDDFSFEWTVLNAMASMEMWLQLSSLFIKPNWLTKKNNLKTVMNAELFVVGLSRHKPPVDVLEQYLHCISDTEKSLFLAQKLNCHKFIIQAFINQKDRLALISYRGKIVTQSEEYFMLENALQASDKKWKN